MISYFNSTKWIAATIALATLKPVPTLSQEVSVRQQSMALSVWRKSLSIGFEQPVSADIAIVQRLSGKNTVTKATIKLGKAGKYRIRYSQPKGMSGKEIVADGKFFWQIDPSTQTILKLLQVAGTGQGGRMTDMLIEKNYSIKMVSENEDQAGIRSYLLQFLPNHVGMSTQKRWIDKIRFRTVRIETRYPDNILFRDVSYENIRSVKATNDSDFIKPNLPSYHEVDQTSQWDVLTAEQRIKEVRRLGLKPDTQFGFNIVRISKSMIEGTPNTQVVYHDGIETISIFVQDGGRTAQVVPAGWTKIFLGSTTAFQQSVGHTNTVVWSRSNHRYSAVSHIAVDNLHVFLAAQIR